MGEHTEEPVEIEVDVKEEKLKISDMKYSLEDTPSLPMCMLLGFQVSDLRRIGYQVIASVSRRQKK